MDKIVRDFIVIPIVVLIGIYVAGVFVKELFNLPNAIQYLFHGVGGIGFLVLYFRERIRKL